MSTTASPVTQVALTDVNSATAGLADPGPLRMTGIMSSRVPSPQRTANDTVMERAGERRPIRACWAWERITTSDAPCWALAVAGTRSGFPRSTLRRARSTLRRGSLWARRRTIWAGYSPFRP